MKNLEMDLMHLLLKFQFLKSKTLEQAFQTTCYKNRHC